MSSNRSIDRVRPRPRQEPLFPSSSEYLIRHNQESAEPCSRALQMESVIWCTITFDFRDLLDFRPAEERTDYGDYYKYQQIQQI